MNRNNNNKIKKVQQQPADRDRRCCRCLEIYVLHNSLSSASDVLNSARHSLHERIQVLLWCDVRTNDRTHCNRRGRHNATYCAEMRKGDTQKRYCADVNRIRFIFVHFFCRGVCTPRPIARPNWISYCSCLEYITTLRCVCLFESNVLCPLWSSNCPKRGHRSMFRGIVR